MAGIINMADKSPNTQQELAVRPPLFLCADGKKRHMHTPDDSGNWDWDGAFAIRYDPTGNGGLGAMIWEQRVSGTWVQCQTISQ